MSLVDVDKDKVTRDAMQSQADNWESEEYTFYTRYAVRSALLLNKVVPEWDGNWLDDTVLDFIELYRERTGHFLHDDVVERVERGEEAHESTQAVTRIDPQS